MAGATWAASVLGDETRYFLTDAGGETHTIYKLGHPLNNYALFELLQTPEGLATLETLFASYHAVAVEAGANLLMGAPTWRASADHMRSMGYEEADVARVNTSGAAFMRGFRERHPMPEGLSFVVGADCGPRGDGYAVAEVMTVAGALEFHAPRVAALKAGGAEVISALTMNYVDEAAGITLAASSAGLPAVVFFTVEVDGRLPDGTSLADAILATDAAVVAHGGGAPPLFYGVNCAHPIHLTPAMTALAGAAAPRLLAYRPNASTKSHAELDEATELDAGDPEQLAAQAAALAAAKPGGFRVIGGCCGTDDNHLRCLAKQMLCPLT